MRGDFLFQQQQQLTQWQTTAEPLTMDDERAANAAAAKAKVCFVLHSARARTASGCAHFVVMPTTTTGCKALLTVADLFESAIHSLHTLYEQCFLFRAHFILAQNPSVLAQDTGHGTNESIIELLPLSRAENDTKNSSSSTMNLRCCLEPSVSAAACENEVEESHYIYATCRPFRRHGTWAWFFPLIFLIPSPHTELVLAPPSFPFFADLRCLFIHAFFVRYRSTILCFS